MEKLTLQYFPYKFWIKHSNRSYTIIKFHKVSSIVLCFNLSVVISIGEFLSLVSLLEELTWQLLHNLSLSLTQELVTFTWIVSFLVKYSQDFSVIVSWIFKISQFVLVLQQQTGRHSLSTSQMLKYSSNLKITHTVKIIYVHIFLELYRVSTKYCWEIFSLEIT